MLFCTPVDESDDDSNTSQDKGSAACKAGVTQGEKASRRLGGGGFVDLEAGRSSGSEADDDAEEEDDEVGSLDDAGAQDQGPAACRAGMTHGLKASRFVDAKAGHSSGSDGDRSSDDDEAGSLDDFVVNDEEATSSNCDTESDEECDKPRCATLTLTASRSVFSGSICVWEA